MGRSYNLYVAVTCYSDRSPLHWLHTIKAYSAGLQRKRMPWLAGSPPPRDPCRNPAPFHIQAPHLHNLLPKLPRGWSPMQPLKGEARRSGRGHFMGQAHRWDSGDPQSSGQNLASWPHLTAEETGKLTTSLLYHPLSKYSYERIALPSNFPPKSEFGFGC